MATTAKSITGDIRWIMEDNRLDRHPDFKVQTSRAGDCFVTAVYGVDANAAARALEMYVANHPKVAVSVRGRDGFLAVTQPVRA